MQNSNTEILAELLRPNSQGLQYLLGYLKKHAFQDPNKSLQLIDEGLKISNRYLNPNYRLDLLTYKGAILLQQGLFPHALALFEEALQIAIQNKNDVSISRIYNNLGLIYKSQEKYTEALEVFTKSLKYSESKQNPYIYSNIGSIYYIKEDWDKALQYFTNALYLAEKHQDVQILCVCCINIGDFHKEKGNYPKAIQYLERGLSIAQEHKEFTLHEGMFLQIMGATFGLMHAYEEALIHIQKANKIYREHGFHINLAQSLIELAEVYYEKENFYESKEALTESIQISTKRNYGAEHIQALKLLIKCFDAEGNLADSNRSLKTLIDIQHTHFTKERDLKVKEVIQSMDNEVDVLIQKNQQIERQNSLLEASNKELKQYAYIIAHDLKEPLRNINSFTNLIRKYNAALFTDDSKEFMKIVEQNTAMMSKKLDDLLGYVAIKLDSAKLEMVDVENMVYKVLNVLQKEIQSKAILVKVKKLQQHFVEPAHLRLLFYHVIQNAIQYSDPNKSNRTITISSRPDGDHIEYCINDNGIGIHEDYHKKIFMIFQQLRRYENGGTGIGLAVCEKIVRLYNGRIWVDSKEGMGTMTYFTLKRIEQ